MSYRAIHPTTLVSESTLARYLGEDLQSGEVEVLEVTSVHRSPELWMVTYALRNEEKPAIYWEYLFPNELEPFLDEQWHP